MRADRVVFDEDLTVSAPGTGWGVACSAVLFDMDGTLVDSETCVNRTWVQWATRHGLEPQSVIEAAAGRRNDETVTLLAPHLDRDDEVRRLVEAEEACRDGLRPVPGARELLRQCPPHRWALVTSAWQRLAGIRLSAAGLPRPAVLVAAEDVRVGKPDPEGMLRAAAHLGVPPKRCLVIEDARAGLEAAAAAGMTAVAVLDRRGRHATGPADYVVPDLTHLRITVGGKGHP